jgi:hypothetical protein
MKMMDRLAAEGVAGIVDAQRGVRGEARFGD